MKINPANSLVNLNIPVKIFILVICGFIASASMSSGYSFFRPEPFILYNMFSSIFTDERDFSILDATIVGMVANVFYPITFGVLGLLFATIYMILKLYQTRLAAHDSLMLSFLSMQILSFYQAGFLLFYKYKLMYSFGYIFMLSTMVNLLIWAFIVKVKYFLESR